jgi:hypothetical protein
MHTRRIFFGVGLMLLSLILLRLGSGVALAQTTSPFATNTPVPSSAPFATNTPQPSLDSLLPSAPFERYALRQWTEAQLIDNLLAAIQAVKPGDDDSKMAVRLLQHELEHRFPGAPRDTGIRAQLVDAMLAAPRGSVDMRPFIRPYIEAALNEVRPALSQMNTFEFDGFNITIMSADLDGDDRPDAVIQTRYPALTANPDERLYQDFVAARLDESGNYHILEADPLFPAAPLDNLQTVTLERLGDMNQDGIDEIALSLDRGDVNQELMIFGWRGGRIISLVEPGARIFFGEIADWPLNASTLTIREYRVESPAWGCLGEREIPWSWNYNFFRPPAETESFTFQNRIGCLLYGSEPLFEQPLDEAIRTIETIVPLAEAGDESAVQRAAVTLAMLRLLNGDIDEALDQVRGLEASAQPDTWLADQTGIFLVQAAQSSVTPIQLCAALQTASTYGACNVEQVLTRLFQEQPLSRDQSIESQLGQLGITVLDTRTISEIGRLNREAVHFNLGSDQWWAFAPLAEDTYTAEKIAPPAGHQPPAAPLPAVIQPPENAYATLLVNAAPAGTLNMLDNAMRDNPGADLSPSARFLQALCYDLLGDRANARAAYFALWTDAPASLWGQLAAAHLEQR